MKKTITPFKLKSETPIQYVKGVGPRLADVFAKRGIRTVGELLEWYPRAYEDHRQARNIASLKEGELVSLKAQVLNVQSVPLGKSQRKMYNVVLGDSTGKVHCKYFRVPYKGYFQRFQPGQMVRVVGKVLHYRSQIEFHHPDIRDIDDGEEEKGLIPIYTETEGMSGRKLRQIFQLVFEQILADLPDYLPQAVRKKYELPERAISLKSVHIPPENAAAEFANLRSPFHRRIIFEEFFWLELFLAARRSGIRQNNAPKMNPDLSLLTRLRDGLPFQLTGAQKKALQQILEDMQKGIPMHRMLQGDVGSGKTIVVFLAACFAASNGYQSTIMVPTEILAEQHYNNATRLFEKVGLKVALLTGAHTNKERKVILEQLASGEVSLCVGTHALIQEDVQFHNLGFVIVDEQHRFGVHQRANLKGKGLAPHFLVMTATPIPRTLAMTVYGDLDISIMNELPKGRPPITTRVTYDSKRMKVMQFMSEQIAQGRQAYVVYPLVEESEKIDLKDAVSEFEKIKVMFPKLRVGLLHGRMKDDEKESVMNAFRCHEIDILVSTTVIEVGVDVPNANFILIEHAERFGLSQLHQLRGRVGRGIHKSYCVLMLGHAVSHESYDRVKVIESTTDGFKIAEADLEIRGPGEFLGSRQSGLPGFRMANLVKDVDILQQAREAAFQIFTEDPHLRKVENFLLRQELLRTHGPTALASIG